MTIKRPSMSTLTAPSSPPKLHINPVIARGKMSEEFLKPCTAHISPGVIRRPFNGQRSMTLPRKVNSSSYSVCTLPRHSQTLTRSLKKKSTFYNSKQSLKEFLQSKPQCMLLLYLLFALHPARCTLPALPKYTLSYISHVVYVSFSFSFSLWFSFVFTKLVHGLIKSSKRTYLILKRNLFAGLCFKCFFDCSLYFFN